MNSLYTLALRQSSSLSSDIQHLASLSLSNQLPTSSSPLYSQISTGFTQWDRTIDDYEDLAKREIVQQKKDKALARVARFRQEYQQLKRDYERVKSQQTMRPDAHSLTQKTAADRSELFAPSSSIASTSSSSSQLRQTASSRSSAAPPPDSFDSPTSRTTPRIVPNSPWVPSPSAYPTTTTTSSSSSGSSSIPPTGSDYTSQLQARQQQKGGGYGYDGRTDAALREHDFLGQTGQALDAYLAQGQAVLGNLASQRDVLKGTQRRLLSAANTLGLSRSTITFIERRTKEDYYILLGGGAVTLVCFWFILRYLG
ncbi:hypothetical protein BMF94_5449 [Rhodotorula taiwanensis]|uniref:Protein transport protein BOS1 n=1 Tax=Rhodotorula taiwanensis TaxID=741276 RepID=A0A2S5B437_9BASI|nr:hypothetical protein BMF94_5449 [Rhodotorula taiwanensis]